MAINLTKNKDALTAAWQSVVDDKSPINWAVYGYEGQTNTLKVVSTGKGGLEEMIDELNEGLIMYAFCRVIDKKTTLHKCVLINWQGEGAPIVKKGTCANHIRDIEKLLKGAHITISARSEEDVEVELIMEKLSRATGSSYKFNEPRGQNGDRSIPIGTTYRRVIPAQEINASERDQFWQKEEMEEKQRLEQERIRHEQNRKKLEEEAKRREEQENKLREQKVAAKESIIAVQRKAEQRAEEIKNLRNQIHNKKNQDSDDEPMSRCDELRRLRIQEAQELMAQRTINARAIFEQNSSAGQTKTPIIHHQRGHHVEAAKRAIEQNQLEQNKQRECVKSENRSISIAKPVRAQYFQSLIQSQSGPNSKQEQQSQSQQKQEVLAPACIENQSYLKSDLNKQPTQPQSPLQFKSEPSSHQYAVQQSGNDEVQEKMEETAELKESTAVNNHVSSQDKIISEAEHMQKILATPSQSEENINEAENELYGQLDGGQYLYLDPNNQGMKARALYDYQAADETEITFDPGDIITHIDAIDEGWWQGLAPDGTYGLFPANHVEVIDYGSS
ncbi:unnamed protein product [Trichogramma brassicae]|uniref:Coactosin-like protein n=1 Tax=Trichogramma brassicae TaxID=86971 RepID=A0A6H5I811_9HYME|nr:unnamed protein product [Trichogramma brassicae]